MKENIIKVLDTKNLTSKLKSRNAIVQTVTINKVNPKVYTYTQGTSGMNIDTITYHLLNDTTRKAVFACLRDIEFVEHVIEKVTGARSGRFKTDIALVTFDQLHAKIKEEYEIHASGRISFKTLTVLTGFFIDLFKKLKIITSSGSIESFEYYDDFYLTKQGMLEEMKRARLEYTLSLFDLDIIESRKEMGVSAIAGEIVSQAYSMETSLISLDHIETELNTTLSLLYMYLTGDFSKITKDEQTIFDESIFLNLARNMSFVNMALSAKVIRPKSSYNFWNRALERVDSALKSSSRYNTIEIAGLKEYYNLSIQNDNDGMKKSLVISRNITEQTPLQLFHKMDDTLSNADGMWRLIDDEITSRYMESAYESASKLKMKDIHQYAAQLHTLISRKEDAIFASIFNVNYEDLSYLAVANGSKLEVITEQDSATMSLIAFRLDVDGARVRTPLANFVGTLKTLDPVLALLVEGEDYEGKFEMTNSDVLISDAKRKLFVNAKSFMDNRFVTPYKIKTQSGKTAINLDVILSDLIGSKKLDDVYSVKPFQGKMIYDSLFQFFDEIISYNAKLLGKDDPKGELNNSFRIAASNAFVHFMKGFLTSRDVQDMVYTAKGIIWSDLDKNNNSSAFGRSFISDYRVENKLAVQMGLLFLNKLGFITQNELGEKAMKIFDDANVFSQMNLLD